MKSLFTILLISLTLSLLVTSARRAKQKEIEGGWEFQAVRAVKIAYLLAMCLGVFLIAFGLQTSGYDRNVGVFSGCGFVLFAVLTWPKTVYWKSSGLSQRNWRGAWKSLPWNAVSEAKLRFDGTFIVRGNASTIKLSHFYAGFNFFLQKLRERRLYSGKNALRQVL